MSTSEPQLGVRAQAKIRTRDAVLQAARDLLADIGYEELTIRQVADRAGVAPGTIFLHAQTKQDLLMQAYAPILEERWNGFLERTIAQPPLERVRQFYTDCLEMYLDDRINVGAFYREMNWETHKRYEEIERLRARLRSILTDLDPPAGDGQTPHATLLELTFWGLYSAVIFESNRGMTPEQSRTTLASLLRRVSATET